MFRHVFLLALCMMAGMSLPTAAASFDCSKASTPFERAICDDTALSMADERLAATYQTAIGGLSDTALAAVRGDQRNWLDYAQRACAPEAKPMSSGKYNEDRTRCLVSLFNGRSTVLESSRMVGGKRFYPRAAYFALPDPDAEDPDSYWAVATHELSYVQLDADDDAAKAFNAYIEEQAQALSGGMGEGDESDGVEADGSSDTINSVRVKEADYNSVTLDVSTYWYGHGAAHGNWTVDYMHYRLDEKRPLVAEDIFAGKRWKTALLDLTVEALQAEHGEELMLDDTSFLAEVVTDSDRWDLSDPYSLILQFQPYEVSYYAYGAPTARVPWTKLQDYLAEDADTYRN